MARLNSKLCIVFVQNQYLFEGFWRRRIRSFGLFWNPRRRSYFEFIVRFRSNSVARCIQSCRLRFSQIFGIQNGENRMASVNAKLCIVLVKNRYLGVFENIEYEFLVDFEIKDGRNKMATIPRIFRIISIEFCTEMYFNSQITIFKDFSNSKWRKQDGEGEFKVVHSFLSKSVSEGFSRRRIRFFFVNFEIQDRGNKMAVIYRIQCSFSLKLCNKMYFTSQITISRDFWN